MKIGFVGLGKMGSQIVSKLLQAGFEVVAYDTDSRARENMRSAGADIADGKKDLVSKLEGVPIVWFMLPESLIDQEISEYAKILRPGSIIIDGGNTHYTETIDRFIILAQKGLSLVDIGTSGGILGLRNGFSLMVGGTKGTYDYIAPVLDAIAKPNGGHSYVGSTGSGHYVKMVHNGVEYGMMQALAEGYNLLKNGPMRGFNLEEIANLWQHGSIVQSTLNSLVAETLSIDPELSEIDGYVADSGEGRWTLEAAKLAGIEMPALKVSLDVRRASQLGVVDFSTKMLASLRNKFGGHNLNKE